MFTSKAERTASYIVINKDTANVYPGQYNTNKSTLKHSRYNGFAPFMQAEKKKSYLDDELKQNSTHPGVGSYDNTHQAQYIRGAREQTSTFASSTDRFATKLNTVPGPGQYFSEPVETEVNSIKPRNITQLHQVIPAVNSIPYEAKFAAKSTLERDARTQWMADSAGREQLYNPSCTAYTVKVSPDMLTGGDQNARSAWARAPERDKGKKVMSDVGPGRYKLTQQDPVDKQKSSASVFKSNTQRFTSTAPSLLGPGCYQTELVNSLEQRADKNRAQTELKQEMKDRLREADQLARKLHPAVGPEMVEKEQKESYPFFTAQEKAMLKNPAVGTYTKSIGKSLLESTAPKYSQAAQMKIALHQTFLTQKWPATAAAIPERTIVDQDEVAEEQVIEKQQLPGRFDRMLPRNLEQLPTTATKDIGPGQYDPVQLGSQKFGLSAPFADTYQRDEIFRHANQSEKQQLLQEQKRKQFVEEQQERRQIGGKDTAVSFTLAKVAPVENVKFGSCMERNTEQTLLQGRDMAVPAPGAYDPNAQKSKLSPIINAAERQVSYMPNETIPSVLREDQIGPGAERAIEVLADRHRAGQTVGPGSYNVQAKSVVKKSFNAFAEDNVV